MFAALPAAHVLVTVAAVLDSATRCAVEQVIRKMPCQCDEVHTLCVSEGSHEKDRAIRERMEERLLRSLEKLQVRLKRGRLKTADKIHQPVERLEERCPTVARHYQTHIFMCVLAHRIPVTIEKTLHEHSMRTSWGTIRETLETHQVSTTVLPITSGKTLKLRKGAAPEPQHKRMRISVHMPSEVMKPIRT